MPPIEPNALKNRTLTRAFHQSHYTALEPLATIASNVNILLLWYKVDLANFPFVTVAMSTKSIEVLGFVVENYAHSTMTNTRPLLDTH